MQMLAIDLAKQSFHVHGVDADGQVISRRVSRAKLPAVVASLAPKVIAMEACATAHHWARGFLAAGHEVRLINPRFVKPFVRGSKNDAVDAEAIFDAASRPTMRFVPVKSTDQQDLQSLHRVRDRLVSQRTNLINHTRGLLAEYGLVYPKGAARFPTRVRAELSEAALSPMAHETFAALLDELETLEERLERLENRLRAICREDTICRRLMTLPGVGPVIATALKASVGDARQFRSAVRPRKRASTVPVGELENRAYPAPTTFSTRGRLDIRRRLPDRVGQGIGCRHGRHQTGKLGVSTPQGGAYRPFGSIGVQARPIQPPASGLKRWLAAPRARGPCRASRRIETGGEASGPVAETRRWRMRFRRSPSRRPDQSPSTSWC